MTDYWSKQERGIVSGFEIGFVLASGTISEGNILEFSLFETAAQAHHTQYDGQIVMQAANALASGCAVALKAASDGETFPVMFYGIHKLQVAYSGAAGTQAHQVFAGSLVCNSASATLVCPIGANVMGTGVGQASINNFLLVSHVLGKALQYGVDGDEILVLVGSTL